MVLCSLGSTVNRIVTTNPTIRINEALPGSINAVTSWIVSKVYLNSLEWFLTSIAQCSTTPTRGRARSRRGRAFGHRENVQVDMHYTEMLKNQQ